MKPQKIKGLYKKRGWFYYQPLTNEDGNRPKAVALGTHDFLEAINRSYSEREIPMAPRLLDFLKKWPIEGRFVLEPKKDVFPESPKQRYNLGR